MNKKLVAKELLMIAKDLIAAKPQFTWEEFREWAIKKGSNGNHNNYKNFLFSTSIKGIKVELNIFQGSVSFSGRIKEGGRYEYVIFYGGIVKNIKDLDRLYKIAVTKYQKEFTESERRFGN